jgi:hypothetical protein
MLGILLRCHMLIQHIRLLAGSTLLGAGFSRLQHLVVVTLTF